MTSERLRQQLLHVLKENFPELQYREKVMRSGNSRISPFVPNKRRNKRWMQLDTNPENLSIAMDHSAGDFKEADLIALGLPYGLSGNKTGIVLKNNNAITISVFTDDPITFDCETFVDFLHKHFKSYNKLIESKDVKRKQENRPQFLTRFLVERFRGVDAFRDSDENENFSSNIQLLIERLSSFKEKLHLEMCSENEDEMVELLKHLWDENLTLRDFSSRKYKDDMERYLEDYFHYQCVAYDRYHKSRVEAETQGKATSSSDWHLLLEHESYDYLVKDPGFAFFLKQKVSDIMASLNDLVELLIFSQEIEDDITLSPNFKTIFEVTLPLPRRKETKRIACFNSLYLYIQNNYIKLTMENLEAVILEELDVEKHNIPSQDSYSLKDIAQIEYEHTYNKELDSRKTNKQFLSMEKSLSQTFKKYGLDKNYKDSDQNEYIIKDPERILAYRKYISNRTKKAVSIGEMPEFDRFTFFYKEIIAMRATQGGKASTYAFLRTFQEKIVKLIKDEVLSSFDHNYQAESLEYLNEKMATILYQMRILLLDHLPTREN